MPAEQDVETLLRQLALKLGRLLLRLREFALQRRDPLLDLIGRGVQLRRDLTEPIKLILDVADGGVPGDRLDAANSGADAALADDHEGADHGGFGDVAAAAEFVAVALIAIAASATVMVRTRSPYFSPNSAIAPSARASASDFSTAATG